MSFGSRRHIAAAGHAMIVGGICYLDSWLRDNCSALFGGLVILMVLLDLGDDSGGFTGFGGLILMVLLDFEG